MTGVPIRRPTTQMGIVRRRQTRRRQQQRCVSECAHAWGYFGSEEASVEEVVAAEVCD